jgi:hypothetical protein
MSDLSELRESFLYAVARVEPEVLRSLRTLVGSTNDEYRIRRWARCWHLTDAWLIEVARSTIQYWREYPNGKGWSTGWPIVFVTPLHQPERFTYSAEWCDFDRRGFEKQVIREVRERLRKFCDTAEIQHKALTVKRRPLKRGDDHFLWLARRQVKGESYAGIFRSVNEIADAPRSRQAFEMAIHRLANQISLTLRRDRS